MRTIIWKQFRDTHYSASTEGEIRNDKTGKILKPRINSQGYCFVGINGKTYRIHRIIAELFIPNPNNLPQVNHKDQNKQNNSVENLEWCDNRYNKTYTSGKPVEQLQDGIVIGWYHSVQEAADKTGIPRQDISGAIHNRDRRKSAGPFQWRFC